MLREEESAQRNLEFRAGNFVLRGPSTKNAFSHSRG